MRLLLGIILGVLLTIGGAYIYDSGHANVTADTTATGNTLSLEARPMVNWDVVSVKWNDLTEGAKAQWHRVTANIDASKATSSAEPRG